jgi:hypothetical protein
METINKKNCKRIDTKEYPLKDINRQSSVNYELPVTISCSYIHRTNENVFKQTHGDIHIGKRLCDAFPIQNGLKKGDALSPLFFNFALEYTIRNAKKENEKGLEMNGPYQFLVYCDDNLVYCDDILVYCDDNL